MRFLTILFLILVCSGSFFAIVPPLEREINLSVSNEEITRVLDKIEEQTSLVFSYNSKLLNGIAPVSLQLRHKTVREALALILPKSIIYKSKNNYIILKEKPEEKNPKKTEISGYVYDKTTEKKLADVTIYDKESLQSVTTDEYGFYSISVPSSNEKITVNKENYKDTTLSLSDVRESKIHNITIDPLSDSQRKRDSTYWKDRIKSMGAYTTQLFRKFKGYVNTINITDTINRKFQVSVFPFIGTNHKLSGNVINRLSFNIYGGFARGVNGFEIGGLFNIDRENVKGVQMAGIFNIVGDSVKGTQLASYFNITGNAMIGFQGAGLMNLNSGTQKGMQAAGLMNFNRKSASGASIAGLLNITNSARGSQIAGLGNMNDTLNGIAFAGLFNVSANGGRVGQVAGLFNKQKEGSTYVQVAGLFNSTHYLKGVQIAPFNYADSAKGVPIGFLSFVKKGVHQIELNGDELFHLNLSFRTGVPVFYNIFSIGFQQGSHKNLWQVGYGAGTSFKIKNKWRSDVTLSMHHVSSGSFYFATSELYRLYWGVEYKASRKFSISAGPTFNLYLSDALLPDYQTYNNIMPYKSFDMTNSNDFNLKGWIGGRIALRFL
jgi:hypothetical protein